MMLYQISPDSLHPGSHSLLKPLGDSVLGSFPVSDTESRVFEVLFCLSVKQQSGDPILLRSIRLMSSEDAVSFSGDLCVHLGNDWSQTEWRVLNSLNLTYLCPVVHNQGLYRGILSQRSLTDFVVASYDLRAYF